MDNSITLVVFFQSLHILSHFISVENVKVGNKIAPTAWPMTSALF